MIQKHNSSAMKVKENEVLELDLVTDCSQCFGLCCVALFFSKIDGFPTNKVAGIACKQLNETFGCAVHDQLKEKGYKGCLGYDCIGAGQKICQTTFKGQNFRTNQEIAQQMFDSLPMMRGLHELMWFLLDLKRFEVTTSLHEMIEKLYHEIETLTKQPPKELNGINLNAYREKVNEVLIKGSELVRREAIRCESDPKGKRLTINRGANLMGKDMRKSNLVGAQLRGALLIAANLQQCDLSGADLIGADLRDANICGADLSKSLFLTQSQLNVAIGNQATKIPKQLSRPSHWA